MNYKKFFILSFIFLSLIIICGGCRATITTTAYPPVPHRDIYIRDSGFNPSIIEVPVGTIVTWHNESSRRHTVTSGTPYNPSGLFDSDDILPNGTFTYKFNNRGTFNYYCKRHPAMTAKIYVNPEDASQPGYSATSNSQK
ncbi:MAG: cupredoxin domain-containing protein [Candidatus Omnitrophota bacterium]